MNRVYIRPNLTVEVRIMTKKQNNKQPANSESGTKYHQEHAKRVPDYGGNIVDPNASGNIQNGKK